MVSIRLFLVFMCITQVVYSQQVAVSQVVDQLNQSFIAKDHLPVRNSLTPDFSVATATFPAATAALDRIFQQYSYDSVYCSDPQIKDGRVLLTFYSRQEKDVVETYMHVDETGKIRYIDLFDRMFGMQRDATARHLITVPFEQVDGSIILQVKMNHFARPLRLLFDTGADGMAVSRALADSIGLQVSRSQQAKVVGGDMTVQVSGGNTIYLDTFAIQNQGVAIFKDVVRPNLDGIIGNTLAKKFIVDIDYDRQQFSLYTFGSFTYDTSGITVPVSIPHHNIEIPAQLQLTAKAEPVSGNYFFDTGADYYMIGFPPFVSTIRTASAGFKPDFVGTTQSMGIVTPTFNGNAGLFALSKELELHDMPVALMAATEENKHWQPGAAGSIGIKWISRYNFTINLADKKIHFTPNKRYQHPFEFVLANHVFGFKENGDLLVITVAGASARNSVLSPGTQILKINNITAKDLFQKSRVRHTLKEETGKGYKIKYLKNGQVKTVVLGI